MASPKDIATVEKEWATAVDKEKKEAKDKSPPGQGQGQIQGQGSISYGAMESDLLIP